MMQELNRQTRHESLLSPITATASMSQSQQSPLLHYCSKPRILYASTFVWLSVVAGRFLAPFLEHECHMAGHPARIGVALAVQQAVVTVASAFGGLWADSKQQQRQQNNGGGGSNGRIHVILIGVTGSTIVLILHKLVALYSNNSNSNSLSGNDDAHGNSVHAVDTDKGQQSRELWEYYAHVLLQALHGVFVSLVFPVLDGLTIAYLLDQPPPATEQEVNRPDTTLTTSTSPTTTNTYTMNNDKERQRRHQQQQYGLERLHGPVWWAMSNLAIGPLFDRMGFQVCYPLSILTMLLVFATARVFVWQQQQQQQHLHEDRSTRIATDTAATGPNFLQSTARTTAAGSTDTTQYQPVHVVDRHVDDPQQFCTDQRTDNSTASNSSETTNYTTEPSIFNDDIDSTTTPATRHSLLSLLHLLLTTTFISIAFLICLTLLSSGQSVVDNLVFLFFENLGSSWAAMGLTIVIKIAFEVPVFAYAPKLLQYRGSALVLLAACLCYFVRVMTYSILPQDNNNNNNNMYIALLLEPLHGITYGCAQIAMVDFVAEAMPAGYEASGQGLVYLFKEGGSIAGVALGGWADATLGPASMFRISGLLVAIGATVLVLCSILYYLNYNNSSSSSNGEGDAIMVGQPEGDDQDGEKGTRHKSGAVLLVGGGTKRPEATTTEPQIV